VAVKLKFDKPSLDAVSARLRTTARRYSDTPTYVIEYTAPYAIYVHEMTWIEHRIGQAKFLEASVKGMRHELQVMIAKDLQKGRSIRQANRRAAQALLRDSKRLVPVDTGFLRRSGRIRVEEYGAT